MTDKSDRIRSASEVPHAKHEAPQAPVERTLFPIVWAYGSLIPAFGVAHLLVQAGYELLAGPLVLIPFIVLKAGEKALWEGGSDAE